MLISLLTSVTVTNSSKRISIRVMRVFSNESLGVTESSTGGVVSLLPPDGGTIFAQPDANATINITIKKRKRNAVIAPTKADVCSQRASGATVAKRRVWLQPARSDGVGGLKPRPTFSQVAARDAATTAGADAGGP